MSQENVEVVESAIAAVNERDIDRYLACCTEDIQLQPPWTAVEGVYEGPDAVRRFFVDLRDTIPDFQLTIERLESVGANQVLAFLRASATGRASGIPAGAAAPAAAIPAGGIPTANVYDLVDGKIRRVQAFLDREEALEAVGLAE
jgi:ketosteroid isomerase-like protein